MASDATARSDYLWGRWPVLLRLAHQMTGDPVAAVGIVAAAAAVGIGRRGDADLDYTMTAAMVHAVGRGRRGRGRGWVPVSSAGMPAGPLDELRPGQRASVVLAFGLGWDAETIADVRRASPRRVRRDVASALARHPEDAWRLLLADPAWTLPVPEDLALRLHRQRVVRRRRHRLLALIVGVATTLVAGLAAAVDRAVTAVGPAPPTPHEAVLLPWAPRGDLIRDGGFVRAATALWRSASQAPAGAVYVLYAGRVGAGRLAVLQARTPGGLGEIAVVGDHDVAYRHPRLRLDNVSLIARTDVPALAIAYDGNVNISGLVAGPGARVEQLLVAPDVDRVEERSLGAPVAEDRPGFVPRHLSRGLSDPWLDLSGALPSTAVRIFRGAAAPVTGILVPGLVQPVPLSGGTGEPFSEWTGLPHDFGGAGLQDDLVWWSQLCRAPDPSVQLVWTGGAPGFPDVIRFEMVRCPGGTLSAEFLTGSGADTRLLTDDAGLADLYTAELVPDTLGRSSLLVIGSQRVASISTPGGILHTRVVVVPIEQAGLVQVTGIDGKRISPP